MSSFHNWKHRLFGAPIATKHSHHERLSNPTGLAVFASDALSSVAYATEEVLHILILAGVYAAYQQIIPISFVLIGLLVLVTASYYQTIHAYPNGGGSYIVTKENLPPIFSRVAGAAMLIDYILTVAVSVSAGAQAIVSAVPQLSQYVVPMCGVFVATIAYANLRGAKESGAVFSIPTFGFVISMLVLIIFSLIKGWGQPPVIPDLSHHSAEAALHPLGTVLILRAFAASCTAMTGVEAISDGVQAFRKPEAVNASKTLVLMATILSTLFLGISWSAHHYGIVPQTQGQAGYQTVLAQLAGVIFGANSIGFYVIQAFTALILILAANTAFADFPRLASFVARDGLLPRGLANLGDRLVFSNGILVLAVVSMTLIAAFNARVTLLIPLYAVGVFTAFTLSQAGMIAHWLKRKKYGFPIIMNAVGAVGTGIATIILSVTKFTEGAWITVFAVSGIMLIFNYVERHYRYLGKELEIGPDDAVASVNTTVLMLVPRMHKGILRSIAYAKSLSHDVRAVHVTLSAESAATVKQQWAKFGGDIPLVILDSPYRSLVDPILEYVDEMTEDDPTTMVTVIVPQAVPKYPWHAILHNNAAELFKRALGGRKNVVITNVRYFLK